MRPTLSIVAGAVVAVVGAVVLGEYAFDGITALGAGLLLGLFVAEAVVTVGRGGSRLGAIGSGALAAAALLWAGWTSTGHRLGALGWEAWAAVALGAAAGAFSARPPSAARRSRPAPAPTE